MPSSSSSSTVLAQAFAYAGSLFNLFAAFGVVFVGQFIDGKGTRDSRRARHEEAEKIGWTTCRLGPCLHHTSYSFLQISLYLPCISLATNTVTLQPTSSPSPSGALLFKTTWAFKLPCPIVNEVNLNAAPVQACHVAR
ncbi:hypothetical protein BDR04DRAFT_726136 [Suillus decipiens]|nr:hypothetical protein BDR04DRAFT_726136 [Suillus decipiens]